MQLAAKPLLRGLLDDAPGGGLLIHEAAPDALQEAVHADDVLRAPGLGLLQRTQVHLVQPKGVGAVGLADVVGGDGIAQALSHLPVLADDGLTAVVVRRAVAAIDDGGAALVLLGPGELGLLIGAFLDLVGVDVDAPGVGVGVGLDVALVEETAKGLGGGDVAQVEEDLVPEPGVEEVQDGVLGPADVEVDPAEVM